LTRIFLWVPAALPSASTVGAKPKHMIITAKKIIPILKRLIVLSPVLVCVQGANKDKAGRKDQAPTALKI
jgi:hypothetical protein